MTDNFKSPYRGFRGKSQRRFRCLPEASGLDMTIIKSPLIGDLGVNKIWQKKIK
jgi:hypothetical protein